MVVAPDISETFFALINVAAKTTHRGGRGGGSRVSGKSIIFYNLKNLNKLNEIKEETTYYRGVGGIPGSLHVRIQIQTLHTLQRQNRNSEFGQNYTQTQVKVQVIKLAENLESGTKSKFVFIL